MSTLAIEVIIYIGDSYDDNDGGGVCDQISMAIQIMCFVFIFCSHTMAKT